MRWTQGQIWDHALRLLTQAALIWLLLALGLQSCESPVRMVSSPHGSHVSILYSPGDRRAP